MSSMGAPQGTELFTLDTSDFRYCSQFCQVFFVVDSAIGACISRGEEAEYMGVLNIFAGECRQSHFLHNVACHVGAQSSGPRKQRQTSSRENIILLKGGCEDEWADE